jgi:hypothetical protein
VDVVIKHLNTSQVRDPPEAKSKVPDWRIKSTLAKG